MNMAMKDTFDISHWRILWIVYNHPAGLTAQRLVDELKQHGWCDSSTTAEDLGLHPKDRVCQPRAAANDP